jgi:hypothetical protein
MLRVDTPPDAPSCAISRQIVVRSGYQWCTDFFIDTHAAAAVAGRYEIRRSLDSAPFLKNDGVTFKDKAD